MAGRPRQFLEESIQTIGLIGGLSWYSTDTSVPLVDSMRVHALAAVDAALEFTPIKNPE